MIKQSILTDREEEVINKKLNNERLTKQDSFYLSVSIRPKLRQMEELVKRNLLERIEYIPKARAIERKIVKIIKENLHGVDSIILYGSVIQTNYKEYNDIDIMVVTKTKLGGQLRIWQMESKLNDLLKKDNIISDVRIITKDDLIKGYKNSLTLIYQLKDSKIIYGKIKIPNKIELYNIDLHNKLDWSYVDDKKNGKDIYSAIRNTVLVRLLLNKIIDNSKLKESLYYLLGKDFIDKLKSNKASENDKKLALKYLKFLNENTREQIKEGLWEKIEI